MQEEYFDAIRPTAEVEEFYRALGRVNRFFDFAEPFRNLVPKLVSEAECRSLTILDVGAGDGSLGQAIQNWAAKRGWNWKVVNLDTSLPALSLNATGLNIAGSAMRLPFRAGTFDVVVTSQMAHHLTEADLRLLLQEAWRVTRRAIVVCDLHRNLGLYLLLRLFFCFQKHPVEFRADALLSVKRAWRVKDLTRVAAEAGIAGASVKLYFGARVILQAHKNPCPTSSHQASAVGSATN